MSHLQGGGSYSLRHFTQQVLLNDLDKRTIAIWNLVTNPDRSWVDKVPEQLRAGEVIDGYCRDMPDGFRYLLSSECGQGAFGSKSNCRTTTTRGEKCWNLRARLEYWLSRVAHFQIRLGDYRDLPDIEATWFVDPPYNNDAGSHYKYNVIDYAALADWCRSRKGQVIVCENEGATWLPFVPLCDGRTMSHKHKVHKSRKEVIWTQ